MSALRIPENRLLRFCCLMIQRCLRHRVGVQSAALAFYLLFACFPFLLFVSALLGALHLNVAEILQELEAFLPREVLELAAVYLHHAGQIPGRGVLAFGLAFSVWVPVRAANMLLRAVRTAYRLGSPRNVARHWLKTLTCTALLVSAVILSVLLMTVGDRFLHYGVQHMHLPLIAAQLWLRLRFPVIGVAGGCSILILYALAQDRRCPWRCLWPGALAALSAWLLLSWLYARYVENLANYSLLYGSIGAVIVLLIWLNMGAAVLIVGAELNGTLEGLRREHDVLPE